MSFRPSIHGWPFPAPLFPEAHLLGLGAPPSGPGLGGGLCWAALDRYLRGTRVARDTPEPMPGDPLHAELVRRNAAAQGGVWERVREWQERPDGSWRDRLPVRVGGGRDLAAMTRAQWPLIRRRLDAGEPVLLTLLGQADAYRRSRAAWQVLATGWQRRDARIVLSLYDPARPDDDEVRLTFGPAGPLDARITGGGALRGFFSVPYDRARPEPVRAETFADRSVIGLNRKIRGRMDAVAGRRRLDLVARDPDGALLHFHRKDGQDWEGANVTEREDLGTCELHSDPTAVDSAGALHVFARSYVGELLHFRRRRGWAVTNRTDHKRAGPRFRLAARPVPTAGPRFRISVLGVDEDGGLVHYAGHPVLGWKAEQVAGDPLIGDPVAAWVGSVLHVAGTARHGHIVHWEWDGDRWTTTDATAAATPADGAPAQVKGRIVLRALGDTLHIAGRTGAGTLAVLSRDPQGRWSSQELGDGLAGEPVPTSGPTALHLFARQDGDDVLHAWWDHGWHAERIVATRPTLGPVPFRAGLAAWGDDHEIRVWGLGESALWTLTWRADADWSVETLDERTGVGDRHRAGDDPLVLSDHARRPHVFSTDGRGTILHFEPSEGSTPAAEDAPERTPRRSARPAPAQPDAAQPDMVEREAVEPDTVEPVTVEPVTVEREAVERAAAPAPDRGREPSRAREPAPEPLPLLEDPPAMDPAADAQVAEDPATADDAGPEPLPLLEAPSPDDELPYLDFEADGPPPRGRASDTGQDPAPAEAPVRPEPSAGKGTETETDTGTDMEKAGQPATGAGAANGRPALPEIEPMDLSLLDSWPPAPPSQRRRKRQEGEEASRDQERG